MWGSGLERTPLFMAPERPRVGPQAQDRAVHYITEGQRPVSWVCALPQQLHSSFSPSRKRLAP